NLETYLNGLPLGGTIERTKIQSALGVSPSNLEVLPVSWCPDSDIPPDSSAPTYTARFVEKPVLGILFGYRKEVQLGGALMLILPNNIKESEKDDIRTRARLNIVAYLDS